MRRLSARLSLFTILLMAPAATMTAQERRENPVEDPYTKVALEGDRSSHDIELVRAQILIDGVMINGEGPFRFMFDTGGAGGGRLDISLVEKLGLEPVGEVQGGDGSGRPGPMMPMYKIDSLELGAFRAEGVRVLSRDYNLHAADVRGHIDGILGFHLFQEFLLTIDYPNQQFMIERGKLPAPNAKDVFALHEDSMAPTITISIGGVEQDAHIDSGAMGGVIVPERVAQHFEFLEEPTKVGEARTVSGPFDILAARIDGELRLGEHVVKDPRVTIAPPFQTVILGGLFLQDFALTFDQTHHRVRIAGSAPESGAAKPSPER